VFVFFIILKVYNLSYNLYMKIISGISLILGCFLGAGFVSGREIAFYFGRFGLSAVLSIVLTVILFFVLVLFFFFLSNKTQDYKEFSSVYFGRCSSVFNWLLSICILIISSSMLAGTRSLADSLNINESIFVLGTLILTFFVVLGNIQSLSKINTILMPIVIVIMLVACKKGMCDIESGNTFGAMINGSNYVFINIVTLGMFVLEIGHKYTTKEKIIISLLSSLIIGVMLFVICFSIMSNGLVGETMPNLILAENNRILYICMQIGIFFGLFTTLIANILILCNFLNKYIKSRSFSLLITIFLSFLLSSFGFEIIVGYIYSIIGVVGIVLILSVVFNKKGKGINPFPNQIIKRNL